MTSNKLITLTTKEAIELIVSTYNNKIKTVALTMTMIMGNPNQLAYLRAVEEVVQEKIEALVARHDPIAAKLEVVKELHFANPKLGLRIIETIRNIRYISNSSLREAVDMVNQWEIEYAKTR